MNSENQVWFKCGKCFHSYYPSPGQDVCPRCGTAHPDIEMVDPATIPKGEMPTKRKKNKRYAQSGR